MSDHAQSIVSLRTLLAKQEQAVRETKRLINRLAELDGAEKPYPDADADGEGAATSTVLRRDEFYGLALATAIRKYLEKRRLANSGPATVNDMYGALVAGGFKFETRNVDNAKRGLYISLAKNSSMFHRLPGGHGDEGAVFGLMEWYPNAKADTEPVKKVAKKTKKKLLALPPPPKIRAKRPAKTVEADGQSAESEETSAE